jgi:FMN reductase
MTERVKKAALIVVCFPVYNYQPNSAAKNFVEVTNDGWKDKVVSFVANAGGDRSFLAPMPLANSLMVDHRCVIVPQFLYLSPSSYDSGGQLVLEGTTADLFEQQMKSACHLAHTWAAR